MNKSIFLLILCLTASNAKSAKIKEDFSFSVEGLKKAFMSHFLNLTQTDNKTAENNKTEETNKTSNAIDPPPFHPLPQMLEMPDMMIMDNMASEKVNSTANSTEQSTEMWVWEKIDKHVAEITKIKLTLLEWNRVFFKIIVFKKILKFGILTVLLFFIPSSKLESGQETFIDVRDFQEAGWDRDGNFQVNSKYIPKIYINKKVKSYIFLISATFDIRDREIINFASTALEGFSFAAIVWCVAE